jgi:hypothetical protein
MQSVLQLQACRIAVAGMSHRSVTVVRPLAYSNIYSTTEVSGTHMPIIFCMTTSIPMIFLQASDFFC